MINSAQDFKQRTKTFALRVIKLVDKLPDCRSADVLGKQLLRSGTSVAMNYRAACRGRSPAEFRSKLGIVEEEADESSGWIELLAESGLVKPKLVQDLLTEASEITSIVVASIRTSRKNSTSSKASHSSNPQSQIRNPQ
jgi:four helix bundle protein